MIRSIERYRNMSRPAKATIWFAICSIIQHGISMITTPLFTRLLSTEDYGTISIYNSWLSIITIFATMQLATGVFNKAMIKFENDRDGYTSTSLFLSSCITLFLFFVYIAACPFWNKVFELNTAYITMLFLDILFVQAMQLYSIRQRFEFNYKSVVAITLIANILGSMLSVALVVLNGDNRGELKVFGTVFVHIIVYGVVFIKILQKGKKIVALSYWKYALTYNMPLIPHYLSQQILNQSDRIMISRIVGKDEAAVYTVAYQVAVLMNIVTNAVHASFSPWAFQSMKNKQYKQIGAVTCRIIIVIAVVCFTFSLFAPEIILILGGTTYYQAIWIVPPVAMSIVFNMIYSLIGNVAFYYEKTKFVMMCTVTAAITNIISNAIFIPLFGFVAAGYTTLVCYILYSILHYVFMKKICREHNITSPFDGKLIWSIAAVSVVLSVVSSFLYGYNVIRYVVVIVLLVVLFIKKNEVMKILNLKWEKDEENTK